jgi:AcrR family transcriptional regulator
VSVTHPSGDDTRVRILDTALELIAEKGFAGTSTRELSERLGFTKAALYYHFRTKDDLLAALIAPALSDLAALVDDDATPHPEPAVRRDLLFRYVDLVATHRNLIQVVSQDPSVARRPTLGRSLELYGRLSQLLSGQEHPDTTQRAFVRAALGAIHAVLLHSAPDDDLEAVREAARIAGGRALGLPASALARRSSP